VKIPTHQINYVSPIAQIFAAPHHSLAAWCFVAGYLHWRVGRLSVHALATMFAMTLFWSPLSTIGELPFLIHALMVGFPRRLRDLLRFVPPTLASVGAVPVLAFMILDADRVERGFLWHEPEFALKYAIVILSQVLPFVVFAWTTRHGVGFGRTRLDFAPVLAPLLLLPFYGVNFTNDLMVRASIPALTALALMVGLGVLQGVQEGFGSRRRIGVALGVGTFAPALELIDMLRPSAPISTCKLLDAWTSSPWRQHQLSAYLAEPVANAPATKIMKLPATPVASEQRACQAEIAGIGGTLRGPVRFAETRVQR
jgi:hypothetical protein